jgi:hypothetical protein
MLVATTATTFAWTPKAVADCNSSGNLVWTVTAAADHPLIERVAISINGNDQGGLYKDGDTITYTGPSPITVTETLYAGAGSVWVKTRQVTSKTFTSDLVCTATVTFSKAINSDNTGPNVPGDFEFTLTGPQTYTGFNTDTIQVIPGTYTLTEGQFPGYTSEFGANCYNEQTSANAPTVTISAGESWQCGANNQYTPPSPPEIVPTTCTVVGGSGSIVYTTTDSYWSLVVDGTTTVLPNTPTNFSPGVHNYQFLYNGYGLNEGSFTIGNCPIYHPTNPPTTPPTSTPTSTPTPTPTPVVATPTPTATPTVAPVVTPRITPPPTSMIDTNTSDSSVPALLYVIAALAIISIGLLLWTNRKK